LLIPDASIAVTWKTYEPACENVAFIRFVMVVTIFVAEGAAPFNCTDAPCGALTIVQLYEIGSWAPVGSDPVTESPADVPLTVTGEVGTVKVGVPALSFLDTMLDAGE